MDNYLLLESNEKRVVNAKRFNFVAKALFPVNIRVLDEYGVERDRFSNVVSGFSFELGRQGLWKLEIGNGDYGQDVRIYSGDYPVRNLKEFTDISMGYYGVSGYPGEYSYFQINNLWKKSIKIILMFKTSSSKRLTFRINDLSDFGTPSTSYNPFNHDSSLNNNIQIKRGRTSSSSINTFFYHIFYRGYNYRGKDLILPGKSSLVIRTDGTNNALFCHMQFLS